MCSTRLWQNAWIKKGLPPLSVAICVNNLRRVLQVVAHRPFDQPAHIVGQQRAQLQALTDIHQPPTGVVGPCLEGLQQRVARLLLHDDDIADPGAHGGVHHGAPAVKDGAVQLGR